MRALERIAFASKAQVQYPSQQADISATIPVSTFLCSADPKVSSTTKCPELVCLYAHYHSCNGDEAEHWSESDHGGEGGGGSPPILEPVAGRCRTCFALCLYATEPHKAHDMLLEKFFLNNICRKLQCSCCNSFRQRCLCNTFGIKTIVCLTFRLAFLHV